MTDQLKLTYLVGQNDLCGRPNSPLIGRPNKLNMSNILAKKPNDLLIDLPPWTSVGSFLVGRSQDNHNRPVELLFLSLNDQTLVSSAPFCQVLKLSFALIGRFIVLYFLPQKITSPDDQL